MEKDDALVRAVWMAYSEGAISQRERDRLLAEGLAMVAVRDVLQEVEWRGMIQGAPACPFCGGFQPDGGSVQQGHYPDCKLRDALDLLDKLPGL